MPWHVLARPHGVLVLFSKPFSITWTAGRASSKTRKQEDIVTLIIVHAESLKFSDLLHIPVFQGPCSRSQTFLWLGMMTMFSFSFEANIIACPYQFCLQFQRPRQAQKKQSCHTIKRINGQQKISSSSQLCSITSNVWTLSGGSESSLLWNQTLSPKHWWQSANSLWLEVQSQS